jgi:hypothetical protein
MTVVLDKPNGAVLNKPNLSKERQALEKIYKQKSGGGGSFPPSDGGNGFGGGGRGKDGDGPNRSYMMTSEKF